MTSVTASPANVALTLRKLYFTRFAFQIVWAVAVILTASTGLSAIVVILLVAYSVFDVVAALFDRRTSRATGPAPLLWVNVGLSVLAAIGLGIASTSGYAAVMVVFGAWAVTAGAVQLVVGLLRRKLGGQWPMILSGGISVLAGSSFIIGAANASTVAGIGAYAVLGAVFFLISAIRLGRTAKGVQA